jgi:DNA replication ATP-dependent helicase Dna2
MNDTLITNLWDSLERIKDKKVTIPEKIYSLYLLLNIISEEATADENIRFSTLFARLSYLTNEFGVSKRNTYLIHQFRIRNEKHILEDKDMEPMFNLGIVINHNLIDQIWGKGLKQIRLEDETDRYFSSSRIKRKQFQHLIEALLIKIDYTSKHLIFLDDERADQERIAEFDIPHINEPFTKNILAIEKIYKLPVHVNLVDCDILDNDIVRPKAIVINPDYLIDVTSVAAHANGKHRDVWLYGLNKFLTKSSSKYLMIGNIVNYLLDVLISTPDLKLKDLFKELFLLFPIDWAVYTDSEINEIIQLVQSHFNNLKRVINDEFVKKEIFRGQIYLEPSFYCRDYGIQGRLDLFHINEKDNKADIIELKSGSVFMPNAYGINDSHYTQTLLYDMMITSAYEDKLSPKNYILYSKLDRLNLKYAPRLKTQQYGMLVTRNDLIAIDQSMALSPNMVRRVMDYLITENYVGLKGFAHDDLKGFEDVYQSASRLEKSYFDYFVSFVAREMLRSKTGEHGVNKSNGLAALWLENIDEKIDRFNIINHLKLIKNQSDDKDPYLLFDKTEFTAKLSNFRKGDIAVLYPHHHNARNILRHQIFKCSIIAVTQHTVQVRMRSPQYNQELFRTTEFWNIEQDVLSSSFNHMYRSLFSFLGSESSKKEMLLGLKRPGTYDQTTDIELDDGMTAEQKAIVYKAFNTKDYFLIWGPPGTGKTSVVLKNIVSTLNKYTDEKILLVAYTNRAVDEICEALLNAGLKDQFIRIGSRYSIGEKFQDSLLGSKIEGIDKRSNILKLLKNNRIFVSTVASILGKNQLFKIVNIDTIIIDEASQILEPMLVGLLPRFERFIMIGDHKQLPAVVTQNEKLTLIDQPDLNEAGFQDMRISLFERLYKQCKKNGWDNAWSVLTKQGRMHEDIMKPINSFFYEGRLSTINIIKRLSAKRLYKANNDLQKVLNDQRLIYINTDVDIDFNWKTNLDEANKINILINEIEDFYTLNSIGLVQDTIGVITPYRAQIAMVKDEFDKERPYVSVDTVERYQGGARDVIIISLCTNRLSQLQSLVSLSKEGVDRKLNVALTRAKEQIIILGNREILSNNETYTKLIDVCFHLELG